VKRMLGTILAALLTLSVPAAALADDAQEKAAVALTTTLVDGAHGAMTATGIDEAARHARLKEVISKAFAFDVWEKFLVGDRNLTSEQSSEVRSLLPGFLAKLYADKFGNGLERKPEIGEVRPVRKDEMVSAEIPRANGKNLPVEYRVRDIPGRGPLVIDVMVGGVSFLVLKRDEFKSMIDTKGVDGLLAFMRENSI
jgi:ABC-type transporter MlaC component